jgi:Rrf2 family nitric oxide-sensitive transcriptional repressor
MFSQSVDYALRAIVFMGMHPDCISTNEQIANTTKVPSPYLAKILKSLNRAGLIKSQRGVGGGSRLSRAADKITVLQVVNAIEPVEIIDYCPLGLVNHGINLCPMHGKFNQAITAIQTVFAESTVQDLIDEPTQSIPMCAEKPHHGR